MRLKDLVILTFFCNEDQEAQLKVGEGAKLKYYGLKHPSLNSELSQWIKAHRIITKSKVVNSYNGKGFDFLQEEDLKGVMKFLPTGTLLDEVSFQRAVRSKQYCEDVYGIREPTRCKSYDKFETECQVVGLILMKNAFAGSTLTVENRYSNDRDIYWQKKIKLFPHTNLS